MVRRIRRGGGFRRPREPGIWVRNLINVVQSNVLNTTLPLTVADPTLLPAVAATDQRYTLMRLMLRIAARIDTTQAAATVVGDAWKISFGLFFGSLSESVSPEFTATGSVDDWLWTNIVFKPAITAGAVLDLFFPAGPQVNVFTRNLPNETALLDIKTKRKCDADQGVRFVTRVNNTEVGGSGHALTAAVATYTIHASSYWKRTMR